MKIESLQNATVKALVRLKNKKDRDLSGEFLVEGLHMLQEAAQAGCLKQVYMLDTLPEFTQAPVTFCSQAVLNKLSSQKSDAKYIGLCTKPELHPDLKPVEGKPFHILLLDRIQDPGNMGTLIRSACAFGFDGVFCSGDCADLYNPKTIQSTQGALFQIPVMTDDLETVISRLQAQQVTVYGAALHQDSTALRNLSIASSSAVVIGNEGQGIRPEILNCCDRLVHIEMETFESLNAAIAGSIFMYELMCAGLH